MFILMVTHNSTVEHSGNRPPTIICTYWHNLSRAVQAEFAPLRAVDGSLIPWPPHINVTLSPQHAGWTFKAFALYSTTFQEVRLPP